MKIFFKSSPNEREIMRKAIVNIKGISAGVLSENENGFAFDYDDIYFQNATQRAAIRNITLNHLKQPSEN